MLLLDLLDVPSEQIGQHRVQGHSLTRRSHLRTAVQVVIEAQRKRFHRDVMVSVSILQDVRFLTS